MKIHASSQCLMTPLPDGTGVILNLDNKHYYELNASAVDVWRFVTEAPRDTDEVVSRLTSRFDVTSEQARQDVEALFRDLAEQGMVRTESR